jgi:hypothetical protein
MKNGSVLADTCFLSKTIVSRSRKETVMPSLSDALAPRSHLVLLAVLLAVLLLAVLILMLMHFGGMPTLAQSTAAVVD